MPASQRPRKSAAESRDLADVLEYTQYRNFEAVVEKAKLACFNSGHRIEDHFADVSKMIEIGKGGRREINVTLLSRYACYLAIQNADPGKAIVAQGQTYFAVQIFEGRQIRSEVSEKIGQLKMAAPDGKQRFTDCAKTPRPCFGSSSPFPRLK